MFKIRMFENRTKENSDFCKKLELFKTVYILSGLSGFDFKGVQSGQEFSDT